MQDLSRGSGLASSKLKKRAVPSLSQR
ncbi:MAG: hypothetical protein ACR5LG_00720 [Sodalis sp. (in: enterobacteria)]